MDIRNRIQQLLTAINQGVYEKDTELSLSLLAALAGESVLLLAGAVKVPCFPVLQPVSARLR